MGLGTLRRHYGGYDSRQMGRIEDQPRERILEAYYAERDRVKRIESELIARGLPVPPRDGSAPAPAGTNAQPQALVPTREEFVAAGYEEALYESFFGPDAKAGEPYVPRWPSSPSSEPPAADQKPADPPPNDEELERIKRELAYPVGANAGNETSRQAELVEGQDPTDAEPSKSVSLADKGEDVDPDAFEESKKPVVRHTTGAGKKSGR